MFKVQPVSDRFTRLDTPKKAYRAGQDLLDYASDALNNRSGRDIQVREVKKRVNRAWQDHGFKSW